MEVEERLARALEGRYRLGRELGRGGMATVYLAHDLKHNRPVAIKVLDPELAARVGSARFLREIETVAGLTHPHILPLHDSGDADGLLFYVMPYVAGDTLRARLERDGTLAIDDAVRTAREIAGALDYAHRQGVIHRDVKPGNIMFEDGHPVLADFGIARAVAGAGRGDPRITTEGTSLGTPLYMSPEQAAGDGEPDARSDQYSLGCVAYEMLAGEPPFSGDTPRAILARVLTGEPRPLGQARPGLPRAAAAAIHRALARDPADRFASVGAFADALAAGVAPPAWARRSPARLAGLAAAVALVVALAWLGFDRTGSTVEALEAVTATEEAIAMTDWAAAYRLAMALPASVADSVRERILAEATVVDSILTDPAGAGVSWRPLLAPDSAWRALGTTPLVTRLPAGPVLLRLEREGRATRLLWSTAAGGGQVWPLRDAAGPLPDALYVPGGLVNPGVLAGGIWHGDAREVGDYLLDPHEVTNREYREFVEAGGYARREYWDAPFEGGGRAVTWEDAMAAFVDRTGRPGPATWEIGRYPEATADHPVTGVSWFEAAAYARFRGRHLPTLYHWFRAAQVRAGHNVVPLSNMQGSGLAPVGASAGVTMVGAYDMAGNAREWTANAAGEYRLTQGGSWADPTYSFSLAQPLSPFDRSELNGIRLMTDLGDQGLLVAAARPVAYFDRDFDAATPVSDDVFAAYRDIYRYDPVPLYPRVERTDTVQPDVVRERITFDAGYGGERIVLYLFRPAAPPSTPLQPVVYFTGSGALNTREFPHTAEPRSVAALIVRSGRAFAFPVIDGAYERADDFVYPLQDESSAYRDRVIAWRQDIGRTLDYLETRSDMDTTRFGFFGNSLGSRMGAIVLALDPRFRAAVLNVAGLSPKPTQPVVDPFNFLPRVHVPALVMSGQFDPIFPLETSARPFYDRLGSPIKEHYISAGAHFVPWPELAAQTLDWLDRYLGPVPVRP